MPGFKKKFAAIFALIFASIILLNDFPVLGAAKPAIPQIRFVNAPVTEYKAGDRIKFDLQSPGYSGKVEYRVVLWEDAQKSYSDLWHSGNGFPSRYYTKWQPTGGSTFNLGWVIDKPGSYRITVYVRRVGYSGNRLAIPGANCDSYKESVAFTVKPNEIAVDTQGGVFGSEDPNNYYEINSGVRVNGRDNTYNNTWVHGNMRLLAGSISLNNVRVDGTLYVDPGNDESVSLNNIYAKNIQMLSRKDATIELKGIRTESLTTNFSDEKTLIAGEGTQIDETYIGSDAILDSKSGSFGKVYLTNKDNSKIDLLVKSQLDKTLIVQTDAYIKVINGNPDKPPFSLSDMDIAPPRDRVVDVKLEGGFQNARISRTASVSLLDKTHVNELAAFDNASIYIDDNAGIGTLDSRNDYDSVSVFGGGKIDKTYGDIRYVVDKSYLPSEDNIGGEVNAGVNFGIDEDINDKGIVENPALRFRLLNKDGSALALVKNGDVFFDYGEEVEKFKNIYDGYMYSVPVNKDDGTIAMKGGSYRLFLPCSDGKWHVLSFTTKQVGAAGEYRSELTSINGNPYTYTRWKPGAYTPISGYVTLGTSLNDAVKILGSPGKTYIDSDGYYAVYYYPKQSDYYLGYRSYIEMYKINGQFVVTGWSNNNGLKVSVGTKDPKAPAIRVGASKQEVAKAMGTPYEISYDGNGYENWMYPGESVVRFIDNRVVGWNNKGGLKVYIGDKISGAAPINFNSTMTDVIRAMGTPTAFTEGWNGFGYGESNIHFSLKKGRVDSWDNKGNLAISTGPIDTSNPGFTIGSTRDEVYKTSGAPSRITNYDDNSGYWVYGQGNYNVSTVYYDKNGRVKKFENDGKLRVSMGTMDPSAKPFFLGSTIEDVIKAQGTPYTAEVDSVGTMTLYYKQGQVTFDANGKVKEFKNTSGLKVGMNEPDPAAKPFFLGTAMEDVARANGAPTGASGTLNGAATFEYGTSLIRFDSSGKVNYYKNTGNLKAALMEKDPVAPGFKLGSTMEEVAKSNGTPTAASGIVNGSALLNYGDSTVSFDKDGKVYSYLNTGNLSVNLGDKDPSNPAFFIGAGMEDVIRAQGTPDGVAPTNNGTNTSYYKYGSSYIYFDTDGKIVGYNNFGNLNISAGSIDPNATPFFIGSTKEEVISSNGTPTSVTQYISMVVWGYGRSSVTLDNNGKVLSYNNTGNLKVGLGEKDPSAPPFFYGSTIEQVIKAQGTPPTVDTWGKDNIEWQYGYSKVTFDSSGKVVGVQYSSNLNMGLKAKEDSAPPFTIGSSMEDVTWAMGVPNNITEKSYNNTVEFDYSYSTVSFDKSGKVVGYDNSRKNLKVSLGTKVPGTPGFTLGSSMDYVIKSNGTPSEAFVTDTGGLFRYGSGTVNFIDGKVTEWNYDPGMNMTKTPGDPSAPPVTLGTSKEDAIRALGTPNRLFNGINEYDPVLGYDTVANVEAKLILDANGKVKGWENPNGVLRIKLKDKDPSAPPFTLGSSMDDVLNAMGTPLGLERNADGTVKFIYPYYSYYDGSNVIFSPDGKVIGWSNDGNLKVTMGEPDPSAPVPQAGSSMEDVVKYLGTPLYLYTDGRWIYRQNKSVQFDSDGKVVKTYDL